MRQSHFVLKVSLSHGALDSGVSTFVFDVLQQLTLQLCSAQYIPILV